MLKAYFTNPHNLYFLSYFHFKCFLLLLIFSNAVSLYQQSSLEARSCDDFTLNDYPRFIVKYGNHNSSESFEIDESQLIDHEIYYIKCSAKYPIEWITNEPVAPKNRTVAHHAASIGPRLSAHLHIFRTFTNFFDHNTYKFVISTKVRYKRDSSNLINCTCRSTVRPECLSKTITSKEINNRISFDLSIDQNFNQNTTATAKPFESDRTTIAKHNKEGRCDSKIFYVEQAPNYKVLFMCEQQDGSFQSMKFVSLCSNAMSCLNAYRNDRLPGSCAFPLPKNQTCIGCEERQMAQGLVGCESSSHGGPKLLFFSTISKENRPSKLHFRMEDTNPQEMLSLDPLPSVVYIGDLLTISCSVSNFYFARGAIIAFKYSNLPTIVFEKPTYRYFDIDLYHQHEKTTTEVTLSVTNTSLERVYCFAPVWNSFAWVNQSHPVNIQFKLVSGSIIIAVTVTIFVTALLVATMFAILWVKVGKTGRMSLLTSSEIEEFHRGSFADDQPIKKSSESSYGTGAIYDPVYEIKRERLLLDETAVLGHGHFGLVLKGIVKDSQGKVRTDVAVKTLKTKADVGSLKALLTELKILASVGKHTNIVNLVGACTRKMGKGEVYVAVEFCANGNLQNFLRRHRQTFRTQLENDILVIETPIRKLTSSTDFLMTIDLIRWAWEIAKGMEFLTSKKVIHGDLATRNILLTDEHIVKVSDFGMSRQLVDYYYVQKETGPMPWKWMSLESLREYKFSIQSDVWSFGVVLWELFTLAEVPYAGCSWSAEFLQTLAAGGRLSRPKYATIEMYELMRECWKNDPSGRPSFFAIRTFFEDILTQCTSQDYIQVHLQSVTGPPPVEEEYHHHFPLHSPRIIIEEDEEGEDDVFE